MSATKEINTHPIAPWEIAAVVICTIAGAFLRFVALDKIPPGLFYDEAINGLDALTIIREPGWPIFFSTENHMREPLWMYLQALGVLFGGTNGVALRAVGAVAGTVTIPIVWWMTRTLAGPRAALFALLFFTPMRWHLQFSRLAFRTILSPLFCSLICAFAIRTTREMRLRDAVITGALLGASLYTYLAMRLFVLGVGLWGIWWLAANWRNWPATILRRNVAAAAIAFGVVFAPAAIDYMRHPEHFTGRQDEVSLTNQGATGWLTIARQARDVALMPALRGDHVAKHNIPGPPRFLQPVIWGSDVVDSHAWWQDIDPTSAPDKHGTGLPVFDVITGLLFYLGLAVVCVRATRGRSWPDRLILTWLIFGAAASVFSFGAPNMLRLQLLTAASAYVLAAAADWIFRTISRHSRNAALGICAAWIAWFSSGEVYRYFVVYPKHPSVYFEFNTNFSELARWLEGASNRPPTIVVPSYIAHAPTFSFETDSIDGIVTEQNHNVQGENKVWYLLPQAPYPPLQVDIGGGRSIVREFELPNGQVWAVMVE